MYKVESVNTWDEDFFKSFCDFKNQVHKNIPTSFSESITDYAQYFKPDSVFNNFHWIAIIVKKESQILAKCILTWREEDSVGNIGFIDFLDNDKATALMQDEIENQAKSHSLKQLKTPVDINFFIKYRIRLEGGGEPFFGEPIYPDYYHKIFNKLNYDVVGQWDTYELAKMNNIRSFAKGRKKLSQKGLSQRKEVTVRPVNIKRWDDELAIVYQLFLQSYKDMPEFEPISFLQFQLIYKDFKYLINPKLAYIVEFKGVPVGFNINYVDPLKILKSSENKELNIFQKALLLIRLRANFSRLLIAYVGKVNGPNGEEVKGIQFKTSGKLWKWSLLMGKILVCYQDQNSPSRRTWQDNKLKPYAQYVLYGKKIS